MTYRTEGELTMGMPDAPPPPLFDRPSLWERLEAQAVATNLTPSIHIKVVTEHGTSAPISRCGIQSWSILFEHKNRPATCPDCWSTR